MHDEAIAEMRKAEKWGSEYLAGLGYVYAAAGKREEARKTLDELQTLARREYVPPYHFAWIYAGLGEKEKAIDFLEQVYKEHTQHVVDFKTIPVLDSLRAETRFQNLIQRVSLPD